VSRELWKELHEELQRLISSYHVDIATMGVHSELKINESHFNMPFELVKGSIVAIQRSSTSESM